jgi:hypothetical protein
VKIKSNFHTSYFGSIASKLAICTGIDRKIKDFSIGEIISFTRGKFVLGHKFVASSY